MGAPKIFNFWGEERTRSGMRSYDSNSPSGAILDDMRGGVKSLRDLKIVNFILQSVLIYGNIGLVE